MHPRRGAKEAGEPGSLLRNVQDAAPTESIVTSNLAIQRWLDKTVSDRGDVASALVMLGTPEKPGHFTHWPADRPPDHLLLEVA